MKKLILVLVITILFFSVSVFAEISEKDFLKQMQEIALENNAEKKLEGATKILEEGDEYQGFLILKYAAMASFDVGQLEKAKIYAEQLLSLSKNYRRDWNYGNAIHDGNVILGRVAIRQNNIQLAKEHLLKAGKTKGSPQLNTFGPNMSLANDLFENGEKETVIEYFELCKNFWKMNDGRLDSWIAAIKGGGKPYFGANLNL
jgi:tetratricopeptide (TPR) repeat protein